MSWQEWLELHGDAVEFTREDWVKFFKQNIPNRKRDASKVMFRFLLFEDARKHYTLAEIGRITGYHHANIYHGIKRVKWLRDVNDSMLIQAQRDYRSKKEQYEKENSISKAKEDAGSASNESV